jgi:hypothetical protein
MRLSLFVIPFHAVGGGVGGFAAAAAHYQSVSRSVIFSFIGRFIRADLRKH